MTRVAACVLTGVLIACGGASDTEIRRIPPEVETQLATARSATIPSGISLVDSSGPKRQRSLVSAEWSFDLQADWEAYAGQAAALLLRSGYGAVDGGQDALAFANHVPGDSYRVRISRNASPSATRVSVSFSASPD